MGNTHSIHPRPFPKTNLVRLYAMLSCLAFLAGRGMTEPSHLSQIIPDGHQWTVTHFMAGENKTFVFPDDYETVQTLPEKDRLHIINIARHFEKNIEHVRKVGRAFYSSPLLGRSTIVADANLNLREVLISTNEQGSRPLARHAPILSALPAYSRIHIIVMEDSLDNAREELLATDRLERTRLHPVTGWLEKTPSGFQSRRPTRWVRDAFIPGRDAKGEPVLFFPIAHSNISDLTRNDLIFFKNIPDSGQKVVGLPIFVRGGNIQLITAGNDRIMFLGERELRYNADIFLATTQFRPPDRMLLDILKTISGVDRIVVLPNSDHLFHLDMAMSIPRSGIAAVIAPLDPENLDANDLAVIQGVRAELAKLGVRRIDVPTTAARVASFKSVVNGVPFKNTDTGQASFLLPEFPDEAVHLVDKPEPGSLNQLVRDAYSKMSVLAIPLEERFFPMNGNTHCVLIGL
jgi:hypothetical protein